MSSAFIQTLNKNTLCTWYVLPMIGMNLYNFQESNFIDSYLTRDGKYIVVEVADWNLCPGVASNKHFGWRIEFEHCDRLIFSIPDVWRDDMDLFLKGAYSKMSDFAKQTIREGSGLTFEKEDEAGNRRTDAILLALDKHPILREQWQRELSVELTHYRSYVDITDDMELLSVPHKGMFTEIK